MYKKNIYKNSANKLFFDEDYSYSFKENNFLYYEDRYGGVKLPTPNVLGSFQLENISTAIATLRNLKDFKIQDQHIIKGITKIKSLARLQEITQGKIKSLCKSNRLYIDGSHNPLGAKVLNEYLENLNCKIHIILGMMANKNHQEYIKYFKNVSSLTTIDIPNQSNSIKGLDLKEKLSTFKEIKYKSSIKEAISSLKLGNDDIILITGSLYLAGEVLNLN